MEAAEMIRQIQRWIHARERCSARRTHGKPLDTRLLKAILEYIQRKEAGE